MTTNNVSYPLMEAATNPERPDDAILERIRRPLIIRVVIVLAGTILILAGLIGLLLPVVPGWLLIIPGLAILATEFVWAQNLLDSAKAKATQIKSKLPKSQTKKPDAAA